MANMCENRIKIIKGEQRNIDNFLNTFKDGETLKDIFFHDIDGCIFDPVLEVAPDHIPLISGYSKWSPPVSMYKEICKRYDISLEVFYSEIAEDFAGVDIFNPDGMNKSTAFTYLKGHLMHFGFDVFKDMFWELDIPEDYYKMVEHLKDEHIWECLTIPQRQQLKKEWDSINSEGENNG